MSPADISSLIGSYLPEPHAGLLSGMVVGTRETLPPELYDALVNSGTLHIVALSGTNITILSNLTVLALSRLIGRKMASLLTIGILFWFVWFVGPQPPIVRAAIMGGMTLFAVLVGRKTWSLWSFAVACLMMLVLEPGLIADISFQLSAGATLGLILFGSKPREVSYRVSVDPETKQLKVNMMQAFRAGWAIIKENLAEGLRTTLAAQTVTAPLILFHFHRFSWISPAANALIGMVIAPVTAIGVILIFSALVFPPFAGLLSPFLYLGLSYIIRVIMVTGGAN